LPPDWQARLDAAQATITRVGGASDLAARQQLARAWRTVVQVEVWRAGLALKAAPAAEEALRTLATLVGTDRDSVLRTELCEALFAIGQARRIPAPTEKKVYAEVEAIEAAIALAQLPPALDVVAVQGLGRLIKTGHFQVGIDRERAFSAARDLLDTYGSTTDPPVASAVAAALETWARMHGRGTPEHATIMARREELLAIVRGAA
jgi:hypothetical protein